jgi:glycosyltransferase involved in cell wall biosynthesis
LLSAADAFIHTANEDPHPRAVIEAMASALPVVAFAVDGVSETVVHGETGFLVPRMESGEALVGPATKLFRDPHLRREMGERGRERVHRLFSADRTAESVADVIMTLLGPGR